MSNERTFWDKFWGYFIATAYLVVICIGLPYSIVTSCTREAREKAELRELREFKAAVEAERYQP